MAEQNHIFLIKNMVCNRCVLVVTEMLKGLHLTPLNVELGKAVVQEELKPDDWKNIKEALEKYGFEWIDDKRIKELLIYDELSISEIADLLQYSSVAHLSTQFRNVTGMTPSQFKQLKEHKREPLDEI